jgi:hypothetical protein
LWSFDQSSGPPDQHNPRIYRACGAFGHPGLVLGLEGSIRGTIGSQPEAPGERRRVCDRSESFGRAVRSSTRRSSTSGGPSGPEWWAAAGDVDKAAVMRAAGSPANSRGHVDGNHFQGSPRKRDKRKVRQDENALKNAKAQESIGPAAVATPLCGNGLGDGSTPRGRRGSRAQAVLYCSGKGTDNGEGERTAVTRRGCLQGKSFEGYCARGEGGMRCFSALRTVSCQPTRR